MATTITGTSISTANFTGTSISTTNLNLGGTSMSDELANLSGSYKIGKVIAEYNSSSLTNTSSSAWVAWPAAGFTNHTGFTGGSTIYIEAWIPMRNDNTSWGGGYVDTNITFDNGVAWRSLGNHGYDGGVMQSGATGIHGENITHLVTGTPSTDYSVKLRFMFKPYTNGSTLFLNGSHDINHTNTAGFCPAGTDGIADTRLGGTDSNQNWGSYRITEYIPT